MADCLERMSTTNSLEDKPSLSSIRDKLTTFENSMLNSKIKQREEDDTKFNRIHDTLSSLNDQLVKESNDRVLSRETLKKMTEDAANRMLNNVQNKLNKKVHLLAEKLDVLIDKCVTLENSVNELDQKLNKNAYFEMVENDINELESSIKNDIISKADKDTSILDKICYLQNTNKIKINDNNLWNNECVNEIRNNISQIKQTFENENEVFYNYITNELNNIKYALEATSTARKQSDQHILQAIDQMMSFSLQLKKRN
nr:hypothetical protein MACL_00002075 [Theileria orientalis]